MIQKSEIHDKCHAMLALSVVYLTALSLVEDTIRDYK